MADYFFDTRAKGAVAGFVEVMRGLAAIANEGAGVARMVEEAFTESGYMAELEEERTVESMGRIENLKDFIFKGPFRDQGMPDFTGKLTEADIPKLQAFIQGKEKPLHQYAWVDRERGIVRIPIERAMQLLVEESASPPPSRKRSP